MCRAALFLALALVIYFLLPGCTGTAVWDITPPPEGSWPFDRFGNYHDAYADGRHPDADLYYQARARGIDILEVSLRNPTFPSP